MKFSIAVVLPFFAALVCAQDTTTDGSGPIGSITSIFESATSALSSAIPTGESSISSAISSAESSISSAASSVRSSGESAASSASRTSTSPSRSATSNGAGITGTNSQGWAMPTSVPVVEGVALGLVGMVAAMI